MPSDNSESQENVCVVCYKNVDIFSIGSCDHMVCYECSTRMRVLCRQNECPICRQELPKVIFTSIVRPFSEIQNCSPLEDKKYKIYFQNKQVQDAFYKLLEHNCSVCPNSQSFKTFQSLYNHMKKEHNLYYCDLCVEHSKIFTSERKCYTQKNLEQHKRKGDEDDTSHRGHPLCQFCDVRYMDNDCLYRHLRRDHLFCHFCDADGLDLYYSSYDYLLDHFRSEHYVCEEGTCIYEKFTPVFRTDIDLKAHRASKHGKTLGKVAAKQARTLELEFTLKPRARQPDSARKRRPGPPEPSSSEGAVGGSFEENASRQNLPKLDPSEFPSLPSGPGSAPIILPQHSRSGSFTIHAVGRRNAPLAINDENFPVLGVYNDSSIPGTSVRLNINKERGAGEKSARGTPRNVSIHVNHKANGEKNIRIRQDDFPALSTNKGSQSNTETPKWTCISNKKPVAPTASTSASKTSKQPSLDSDFPILNSKFSTNLNLKVNEPPKPNFVNIKSYKENKTEGQKGKKASSVTIPMQNSWPETSSGTSINSLKTKSKKKKSKGGNLEEKSDTAKKKQIETDVENKEKELKDHSTSALPGTCSQENSSVKPLPKVEDWFSVDELKKFEKKSEEKPDNLNTLSAAVSSHSTKLKINEFVTAKRSLSEECRSSSSNNNISTCNGNNNKSPEKSVNNPESKPPPGFDSFSGYFNNNDIKKPPPGFSADFPRSNGLTFTNSSGQSFAISAAFDYTPPLDFEIRNQTLVSKVNTLLSDKNLEEFRKMSHLFRQGMISASEYYDHCLNTMGDVGLQEVFPELLILLPDISKQQELYQVYSRSKNFFKGGKNLQACGTCRQVVFRNEYKQHSAQHSLHQNFPPLVPEQWS